MSKTVIIEQLITIEIHSDKHIDLIENRISISLGGINARIKKGACFRSLGDYRH